MPTRSEPLRVLVTGASAGIGEGFAREFHRRGASVILVARSADKLSLICEELNLLRPGSAGFLSADLGDISGGGLARIEEYIEQERIDVLVNNAGFGSAGFFETLPRDVEEEMIRLNIVATTRLAHAAIPQMKARRAGAIITLSSIAGVQPLPFMATYSATKAYNLHHSMALRYELAPFNVRVLSVCPGPVATEFRGFPRGKGFVSGMHRDSVADVVSESMRAFDRNAAWLIPCLRAKLLAFPSRFLPRTLCTWCAALVMAKPFRERN